MGIQTDMIRVATATPEMRLADPAWNAERIIDIAAMCSEQAVSLLVLPELTVSGYTCGDLFMQDTLLRGCETALARVVHASLDWSSMVVLVGLPLRVNDQLFNCAAVIQHGRILGAVPKQHLPNTGEFYERRWFTPGSVLGCGLRERLLCGQPVRIGQQLFTAQLVTGESDEPVDHFTFGIEICEDLWVPNSPGTDLALAGATVICNLSASNELAGKAAYRRQLVSQQSARLEAAYIYTNAGPDESTTDLVFSAHSMIAEDGHILTESEPYATGADSIRSVDIDLAVLISERLHDSAFSMRYSAEAQAALRQTDVPLPIPMTPPDKIRRKVNPHPFVPEDSRERGDRCSEVFLIQAHGLARRIRHTNCKTLVLGISGGLDSTLALLVTLEAARLCNLPSKSVLGVTMPGFGTTDASYETALELMAALDITIREVNISKSVRQHFADIGHDESVHDITYENAQARERTQILMDIANMTNGLVVGTGDLSELALGWCTYNGDQMSMYGVNASVPKTLVKHMIDWQANNYERQGGKGHTVARLLRSIRSTPISPELLPLDSSGKTSQKTEDVIGPYELHDFFIYHALRYGQGPGKIFALARNAFIGSKDKHLSSYSSDTILKWLENFYRRFFFAQFKRSAMPDGPKVGSVSLSPRGDWRMPSDASRDLWLAEIEALKEDYL